MEPMTEEQRAIFQSLVDEAYDQFVGIVAEGRGMDEKTVRKLADGRIYTAKQAVENGLIDGIATYEEAVEIMKKDCGLEDCEVENFYPPAKDDLYSLLGIMADGHGSSAVTDADLIEELVALNGTFRVSYISNIRK
jgi:protease-4